MNQKANNAVVAVVDFYSDALAAQERRRVAETGDLKAAVVALERQLQDLTKERDVARLERGAAMSDLHALRDWLDRENIHYPNRGCIA